MDLSCVRTCAIKSQAAELTYMQAYEVLSSSDGRKRYNEQLQAALIDEMDDYTGKALSKWLVNTKMGKNWDAQEERAVFVVRSAFPYASTPPAGSNSILHHLAKGEVEAGGGASWERCGFK